MDNHNAIRFLYLTHGEDKAAGVPSQARGAAAPVVENVERIRERQAASRQEIEGLCERLMATAFSGELSTECS